MNLSMRSGIALAVTAAVAYSACTLAFLLWPAPSANFMQALFHGLDFRKLQSGAELFSFNGFTYAILVLSAWAFAVGALFGWLFRVFGGKPSSAA